MALNPRSHKLASTACVLTLVLLVPIIASLQLVSGEPQQAVIRTQRLELSVGDSLIIRSDRNSIQRVLVEGNLTNATLTKPAQYPANDFAITTKSPGTITLKVYFDYVSDYGITLAIQTTDVSSAHSNDTYYMSGGPLELDITAVFDPRPTPADVTPSVSPWDSFAGWMGKFGEAFPVWVKVLYLVLGVQFFAVGGLWIRRETSKRESGAQHLDNGDRAFLWVDIAYKFLLVSFLAIILIMGGELLVLFILRFMFLVSLDLLSLWDLFVVGFAAGTMIIVYLVRFTLEKAFDMKPMEEA
jgi:hypothetical protein